jgi:hypothetical protein
VTNRPQAPIFIGIVCIMLGVLVATRLGDQVRLVDIVTLFGSGFGAGAGLVGGLVRFRDAARGSPSR